MTEDPEMFEIQIFFKFSLAFSMLEISKGQAYICSSGFQLESHHLLSEESCCPPSEHISSQVKS